MNNLGAALLQKQRQSPNNSTIDLAAIQHKFNIEIQQLIATINALKAENDTLKAGNDTLKLENDALKLENNTLKLENDTLKLENDALKAENKPKNNAAPNVSFVFI